MKPITLLALLLSCCLCTRAQQFEAASIRPSPPLDAANGSAYFGSKGGPGTEDPARYTCAFCDVSTLITEAYDIPEYRLLSTRPLPHTWYHVAAAIAPGTTPDQFHSMLQNLLAERFALKVHHEQRPMHAYQLLVSPGGLKLKPHVEGVKPQPRPQPANSAPGRYYQTHATLGQFAKVIENQLQQPVVDSTGLPGEYDFDLAWSFGDVDAAQQSPSDLPTLRSAIQSVGLKIDSHKEQVDVIVIDDLTTSPTEN